MGANPVCDILHVWCTLDVYMYCRIFLCKYAQLLHMTGHAPTQLRNSSVHSTLWFTWYYAGLGRKGEVDQWEERRGESRKGEGEGKTEKKGRTGEEMQKRVHLSGYKADKHKFDQISKFWGAPVLTAFTDHGQILECNSVLIAYSSSPDIALIIIYYHPCEVKNHYNIVVFDRFSTVCGSWTHPFTDYGQVRCMAVHPNFICIGLLCRPWGAKYPKFYNIFNFNILWWRHLTAQTRKYNISEAPV